MTRTLEIDDPVFGSVSISDPAVLDLIDTPTFQRLRRIHQAGPSALVFDHRTVTRFDHSIGVYLLLQRMGASRLEQVAGLLHDISHTAFSHVVDVLFPNPEHDFHERHKSAFLGRADVCAALSRHAMAPEDFEDDTRFELLEQPLPALCADRIDYFLRDGIEAAMLTRSFVGAFVGSLAVHAGRLVSTDLSLGREAAQAFARVDRALWSSAHDRHIYACFSAALRLALERRVLDAADLFEDDDYVRLALERAADPEIERWLRSMHEAPSATGVALAEGKKRWLDPDVYRHGRCQPVSVWDAPTSNGG